MKVANVDTNRNLRSRKSALKLCIKFGLISPILFSSCFAFSQEEEFVLGCTDPSFGQTICKEFQTYLEIPKKCGPGTGVICRDVWKKELAQYNRMSNVWSPYQRHTLWFSKSYEKDIADLAYSLSRQICSSHIGLDVPTWITQYESGRVKAQVALMQQVVDRRNLLLNVWKHIQEQTYEDGYFYTCTATASIYEHGSPRSHYP